MVPRKFKNILALGTAIIDKKRNQGRYNNNKETNEEFTESATFIYNNFNNIDEILIPEEAKNAIDITNVVE